MTKNEQEKMREISTKLLDLFGPDGEHWIRGDWGDGQGNYCLLGGLEKVGLDNKRDLLTDAVKESTKDTFDSVPDFNDAHYWPTIKRFLMKYAHPYQPKKEREHVRR